MKLFNSTADRFWFPLDLSDVESDSIRDFHESLTSSKTQLDRNTCFRVDELSVSLMARHVRDILDRDRVQDVSHILNGWGNATFRSRPILEWYELHLHYDEERKPFLPQMTRDGDLHPWQSFAYASMAGVSPQEKIYSGASVAQVAHNSRRISGKAGRVLGQMLFALSFLEPFLDAAPFYLRGELYTFRELVDFAVDAHFNESFVVCRKIHLTQGLCAAAARVPGLQYLRPSVAGFLEGQLDVLLALGVILRDAAEAICLGRGAEGMMDSLRAKLGIGSYVENHCWYVGHLVELGVFAAMQGYHIDTAHWNAMRYAMNQLNPILENLLPAVSFVDIFPGLGHYRRALTLLLELEDAAAEGRNHATADLTRYRCDFDAIRRSREAVPEDTEAIERTKRAVDAMQGVYKIAPTDRMQPILAASISAYDAAAPRGFSTWGTAGSFRCITPPGWPRAIHYEFLDRPADAGIGLEIHLESDLTRSLGPDLEALQSIVSLTFPGQVVQWDPSWSACRGRLCVHLKAPAEPDIVSEGMRLLVECTWPRLNDAVCRLRYDIRHIHAESVLSQDAFAGHSAGGLTVV
jgi:hypothetical protein